MILNLSGKLAVSLFILSNTPRIPEYFLVYSLFYLIGIFFILFGSLSFAF